MNSGVNNSGINGSVNVDYSVRGFTPETVDFGNACFEMWDECRNGLIQQYLAPHALNTLRYIKERYPNVVVGVITNGNCDVNNVGCFNSINSNTNTRALDFEVRSDVVGTEKGRREIYDLANDRINELIAGRNCDVSDSGGCDDGGCDDGGGVWIHVGDSVEKDCKTSKLLGCYTVLTNEFKAVGTRCGGGGGGGGDDGVHLGNYTDDAVTSMECVDRVINDLSELRGIIEEFDV
jgi:FMN phosphatase YigB (HAD superfamily)